MQELFFLFLLIVLSGIFSGSETALVSISLARAKALHREGRRGSVALYYLKTNPARMLITILIGNNVVNIGASAIATVLATKWLGHLGPGIAVGALTILILIFGEITPKSLATRYSERISLVIAPVMYGFMRLISPLVWLFNSFTNLIHRMTGTESDPSITEAELITMVEHGEEEGTIESDEREMIERVFIFNDLKASDVMTPLRSMFSLDGRRTVGEVLPEILKGGFSRIPLYGEDPNEILSILFVRDLFEAVAARNTEIPIRDIGRAPLFVPENQKIDEILSLLRKNKQHMALVVDDTGYLQGVVTLEDLIEELVGEIYDEHDELPETYVAISEDSILIKGDVEIRVAEEFFDIELPGKPTDTVNQWILEHTERIPLEDECFRIDGLETRVKMASERRIHQVLLTRLPPSDGEDSPVAEQAN